MKITIAHKEPSTFNQLPIGTLFVTTNANDNTIYNSPVMIKLSAGESNNAFIISDELHGLSPYKTFKTTSKDLRFHKVTIVEAKVDPIPL